MFTGQREVESLIETCWKIERAPDALRRAATERVDILRAALDEPCQGGEAWLEMANEILANNYIDRVTFQHAMLDLIQRGRGKFRNILLTGPANCGKTFLLGPLKEIFKVFQNPATSSFAWVGADEAEIIILNDFRWNQKVCALK